MPRSNWCRVFAPRLTATLRLVCFPPAGAGASVFHDWAWHVPETVEVVAVQCPGRQDRSHEAPPPDLPTLAALVATALEPMFDRPVVFFGHSLGATVAFEAARQLRPSFPTPITRLVVSARKPPAECRPSGYDFRRDEDVERYLRRLGGRASAVVDNDELWQIAVPALRGDLLMSDSYRYVDGPPLTCPITIVSAQNDHGCGLAEMRGWSAHTVGGVDEHVAPGDHHYINTPPKDLLALLVDAVRDR